MKGNTTMARAVQHDTGEITEKSGTAGLDPSQFEWETIHEEAPDQVIFDTPGDTYIGRYKGHEVIDPQDERNPEKRFIQLRFRDNEGLKVINAGYELRTTFVSMPEEGPWEGNTKDLVPLDAPCRIALHKLVKIEGQVSPMKSFRVDVARANSQDE